MSRHEQIDVTAPNAPETPETPATSIIELFIEHSVSREQELLDRVIKSSLALCHHFQMRSASS
jgi:hypothetical protein